MVSVFLVLIRRLFSFSRVVKVNIACRYPYPLFGLLNTYQRIFLFTFSALLTTGSSVGLKWVYARVNGYDKARHEAHKPLKKVN